MMNQGRANSIRDIFKLGGCDEFSLETMTNLDLVMDVISSGKDPWVDPACADCPGFLVLSAAPAPASTSVSEPQIVHLD